MFSVTGIEREVSAYVCVQVSRRQLPLWEPVHREHFFGENSPNDLYTMLYNITRRNSRPKYNRIRVGRLKNSPNYSCWNDCLANTTYGSILRLPNSTFHPATYIRPPITKFNIKYHKKIMDILKRTEKQMTVFKTKCGRLFRKFLNRAFILDNESYFTITHSTFNDNVSYTYLMSLQQNVWSKLLINRHSKTKSSF